MATFWRKFHHDGKFSPNPDVGGGPSTPSPFHSIYHHDQSCGVRSSWEGRYTPPISTLPFSPLWPPPQVFIADTHNEPVNESKISSTTSQDIPLASTPTQTIRLIFTLKQKCMGKKEYANLKRIENWSQTADVFFKAFLQNFDFCIAQTAFHMKSWLRIRALRR